MRDLVFAPVCVACEAPISTGARERGVCISCWSRARSVPLPRCDRCWTPRPDVGTGEPVSCALCVDLRVAIRCIRSAFLLEEPVRSIVHALKYRNWHFLARLMARRMADLPFPQEVEEEVEIIVPVPLSAARSRQRGFNQAELLGREVARLKGWEMGSELLQRGHSSGSQTTLHRAERRANVAGAFRVPHGREGTLAGTHLLVIDDVWTTGATTLACADALLGSGARAVSILTFARALPELERHDRRIESLVHSIKS